MKYFWFSKFSPVIFAFLMEPEKVIVRQDNWMNPDFINQPKNLTYFAKIIWDKRG